MVLSCLLFTRGRAAFTISLHESSLPSSHRSLTLYALAPITRASMALSSKLKASSKPFSKSLRLITTLAYHMPSLRFPRETCSCDTAMSSSSISSVPAFQRSLVKMASDPETSDLYATLAYPMAFSSLSSTKAPLLNASAMHSMDLGCPSPTD